jgi:hypothetical protein
MATFLGITSGKLFKPRLLWNRWFTLLAENFAVPI